MLWDDGEHNKRKSQQEIFFRKESSTDEMNNERSLQGIKKKEMRTWNQ